MLLVFLLVLLSCLNLIVLIGSVLTRRLGRLRLSILLISILRLLLILLSRLLI